MTFTTPEAIAFIRSHGVDDCPDRQTVAALWLAMCGRRPELTDGNHYSQWSQLKDGDPR